MKTKIINILFNVSMALFVGSYLLFSYSINIKIADAQGGQSLGGRITSVMQEYCTSGVNNTACTCGCASNYCTNITPYGGAQQPIVCLPISMQTTATPVTPASSGGLILGLFSTLSQTMPSVPVGIVGTSAN